MDSKTVGDVTAHYYSRLSGNVEFVRKAPKAGLDSHSLPRRKRR